MKIQLLHFEGCPNVDAARTAVRDALAAEKLAVSIEEIDVERPDAPEWARGWGSPTILIDGKDVAGQERVSATSCCRLYADGAPSVESIRERIAASRQRLPRSGRVALPVVGALTAAIAPLIGSGNASAGSVEAQAKATLDLVVSGMDCKPCTSTIANAIKKIPGVVSATVDFESGNAVVRYDGRADVADAAIKAVERAGYRAELKP